MGDEVNTLELIYNLDLKTSQGRKTGRLETFLHGEDGVLPLFKKEGPKDEVKNRPYIQSGGLAQNQDEHPDCIYYTPFSVAPTKIRPAIIANMYLKEGLTASQIAKKLAISKNTVLRRLHFLDIRKGSEICSNQKRYWHRIPPYGFKIIDRQLAPCTKEMKICRLIVKGIDDRKLSYRAMARELEKKEIKNERNNDYYWNHKTIISVYKRWQGRI